MTTRPLIRDIISGALTAAATITVGCWLATTTITVPALWPISATALSAILLGHEVNRWRHTLRRPSQIPPAAAISRLLAGDPAELIGRAERDVVLELLAGHYAAERLTVDEYEKRRDIVIHARVRGELGRALRHLPI